MYTIYVYPGLPRLLNLRARCRCWMFWKAFLLDPAAFLCVPLKLWSFVPRKTIDVWRRTDKLFCSDFRVALASKKVSHISGWWFGTWILWLSIYWEFHHPNWRTHIFQRGRSTTNQYFIYFHQKACDTKPFRRSATPLQQRHPLLL